MLKRWLALLIPLAILAALIVVRLSQKRADAAAQAEQRTARMKSAPAVVAVASAVRDIVQTFDSIGSVEAPLNVKIAPRVSGQILYLQAHEGDRVTRGEVLARLDPSEVEAQVRQRQADLDAALSRLAQAQITENPTNVSVSTQIRQQAAGLGSAQADLRQTRESYVSQKAAATAAVQDAQGRIDNATAAVDNARASVRSAQANLADAQAKYNRVYDLYQQGFIAAQDVDDARTAAAVQHGAVDVAQGQVRAAQAQLASAQAQKVSAQRQADIVAAKGISDIAASAAKVTQARAALEFARANSAQRPAYRANLAALSAAVDSARAALRDAQDQRAFTILTSPLEGYVTSRMADPGSMATPGLPLLSIQTTHQVWVNVGVPEEVSRSIHMNQTARITLDAIPGRSFIGRVAQINPAADPASRQFTVRIAVDNAQNLLKPGMFAHVSMVTSRVRGAVVVPREAVQQSPSGSTVNVVGPDGTVQVRPVTLGASDANGIAIAHGLEPGENVVVLSATPLKPGQKVRTAPGGGRSRTRGASRAGGAAAASGTAGG